MLGLDGLKNRHICFVDSRNRDVKRRACKVFRVLRASRKHLAIPFRFPILDFLVPLGFLGLEITLKLRLCLSSILLLLLQLCAGLFKLLVNLGPVLKVGMLDFLSWPAPLFR